MEKTKDLSLSAEDRQEQKNKEIVSRIRGLLNKFQDEAISLDRFNSEYQVLKKEYSLTGTGNQHLIKEICDQIELAKDNQALFDLLAELKVPDFDGLTSVVQEFQTVRATAARERRKILKEQLAKTHFICGSAVVPNLEIDAEWRKESGQINADFEAKLNQAKTELLAG
jgi:hypothetical protein